MGGHRAQAARPGVEAGQGRPPGRALPPRHRRRHPLPGQGGHLLAGDAADFPPWPTVYDMLDGWQESGATEAMHDQLRRQCRIAAGRTPEPSAAIIDSQSVKAAETVGKRSRGFDAGKKINGRKRHIAVDTIGLLLTVLITAAAVQDRDAAKPLLWNLQPSLPRGQARLGRRRLRRQAGHLGQEGPQAHRRDRQAPR